jgi:hypothetical protein
MSPISEHISAAAELHRGEVLYPLHVRSQCFLVQLEEEYESRESIFGELPHFSSDSDSLLKAPRELRRQFEAINDGVSMEVSSPLRRSF